MNKVLVFFLILLGLITSSCVVTCIGIVAMRPSPEVQAQRLIEAEVQKKKREQEVRECIRKHEICQGMSTFELLASWGKPRRVTSERLLGVDYVVYTYPNCRVRLHKGLVVVGWE